MKDKLTTKLCQKLAKGLYRDGDFFFEESKRYKDQTNLNREGIKRRLLNEKAWFILLATSLEFYLKSFFLLRGYDIFMKSKPQKITANPYFDINTSKSFNIKNLIENIELAFPLLEVYPPLKNICELKEGLHILRKKRNEEIHFATYLDSKLQSMYQCNINKEHIMLMSFHNLKSVLEKELNKITRV